MDTAVTSTKHETSTVGGKIINLLTAAILDLLNIKSYALSYFSVGDGLLSGVPF